MLRTHPRAVAPAFGAAAVLLSLLTGCGIGSHFGAPANRVVDGLVRYPSGVVVNRARVASESGTTTFTDGRGRFRIRLPQGRDVELVGRDGFDGRVYAETRSGRIVIRADQPDGGHVIVLDEATPI